MERGSITWNDGETYTEAYARNLGPITDYAKMPEKQLIDRWHFLLRELGTTLVMLRREPDSITGKEMLAVVEPHHAAAVKECRRRLGVTAEATA